MTILLRLVFLAFLFAFIDTAIYWWRMPPVWSHFGFPAFSEAQFDQT